MKMKRFKLLLSTLAFIIFAGCMDVPKDFIAPQWDTELNLPLINKTYTLDDIMKPQDHITVDTTGQDIYLIQSDKYYLNSNLSDFVDISDRSLTNIPTVTSESDTFVTYIQFPGGIEVDSAEFDEGAIDFGVSNSTSADVAVSIALPGFKDRNGNPIVLYNNVPSGQTNSLSENIKGYTYVIPSDQPASLRNSIRLIVRAISPQQGNVVHSDFSMSGMSFHYIKGRILSKSLGNQTSSYFFDVNEAIDYRDKTFLRDAKLNLNVSYKSFFNLPVDLDIKDTQYNCKKK